MKKNRLYKLFLIIILILKTPVIQAQTIEDAYKSIEEGYLAAADAEKMGGNITVVVIMLNQASNLAINGGTDNLQESINIANDAKYLALSIKQNSRLNQIYREFSMAVLIIIYLLSLFLIKKYGDKIYFSLWIIINKKRRITKI